MKKMITGALKWYKKFITPYVARSCRFYPTCSEYAVDAIENHGVIRGVMMSLWRVLRCNPFSRGGYDPAVKE